MGRYVHNLQVQFVPCPRDHAQAYQAAMEKLYEILDRMAVSEYGENYRFGWGGSDLVPAGDGGTLSAMAGDPAQGPAKASGLHPGNVGNGGPIRSDDRALPPVGEV